MSGLTNNGRWVSPLMVNLYLFASFLDIFFEIIGFFIAYHTCKFTKTTPFFRNRSSAFVEY